MPVREFYVHIVESPSPSDLLDGRTEGNTLKSFLELAGIPCQYNLAVDQPRFTESLTDRVNEAIDRLKLPPVLHFSCHGNENGIQLTSQRDANQIINWKELASLIKPINDEVGGVGVCMSSCGGSHGKKMAQVLAGEQVPIGWIVGTSKNLNYADGAIAFATFYRGFQKGLSEDQLIAAIRAASGFDDFSMNYGHVVQNEYSKGLIQKILDGARRHRRLARQIVDSSSLLS